LGLQSKYILAQRELFESMNARILVVDDEADIAALVAYNLARAGYRVSTARSGSEALRAAVEETPDLVVLDLMLPDVSGFEVLQELRKRSETRDVGVILLTARDQETDRLQGLSLGADDYVSKPFSPQELVLRTGAVLRRLGSAPISSGSVITIGSVRIDQSACKVTIEGRETSLTATEYKLLLTLAERRGRVQSRQRLLETVWNANPEIQTRTVDMHVQRLRTKLGPAADLLETVRGFGYRLREGTTESDRDGSQPGRPHRHND
jgi:two-component system phosphate regulon response regulator PhoB